MTKVRQPAEWAPHDAVWLAWPSHEELWGEDTIAEVRAEFVGLVTAIADPDERGVPRGERVELLVRTDDDERLAREALGHLGVRTHRALYGDIWCRDTLPIFVHDERGAVAAASFRFNGWGGKYLLPGDAELSAFVAELFAGASAGPRIAHDFVLEGGAVEPDGEGTLLTSKQCLLHPNRNPSLSADAIERAVASALGAEKVLWVTEGLLHDHTDGHIDTIVRFVAPGRVVCMAPSGKDDPNAEVLDAIARELEAMTDARGRRLEVARIPSPGRVLDPEGEIMPASYANFYIGNTSVVVPTYGTPHDEAAVRAIAALFPSHRVVGRPSRRILEGGGSFHCITQQVPTARR